MKKKYTEKELQEKIQEALKEQDEKIKLEQRFEYMTRELRDNQENNWNRFKELEATIYGIADRVEKLEGKKEKQHKVLNEKIS